MSELAFKPIDELAASVRSGEISAAELVGEFLTRIEALNPEINAFIDVDGDRALASAQAISPDDPRPFAGVPIAVKANVAVEGFLFNQASKFLGDRRATEDAFLVRRLKNAGFIVVGITNMPEFGILPTTEPRFTGPTHNPWDKTRTPGGSSGGSAAAVACGMVPIAHANDGGGSIRIPAACCGLIGLKPSRGRVSAGPILGADMLHCDGVLSNTVAETAWMLDILAGYETGDAYWAPYPTQLYAQAVQEKPERLRIAVSAANPIGAEPDPECVVAMQMGADLLADLGHDVVEAHTPLGGDFLWQFVGAFSTSLTATMKAAELAVGRPPEYDEIEPLSAAIKEIAAGINAADYYLTIAGLQAASRQYISFFDEFDVVLTPALAKRPLEIGTLHGHGQNPMEDFGGAGLFIPYNALMNVTGQPAITVPVKMGDDGLPTSIQLVGPPLGEDVLLQLATQIEKEVQVGHPVVGSEAEV